MDIGDGTASTHQEGADIENDPRSSGEGSADLEDIVDAEVVDDSTSEATSLVQVERAKAPVRRKKIASHDTSGMMKLREFAELHNISYGTAHKHWNQGRIRGKQFASGTIRVWGYYDDEVTPGREDDSIADNAAVLYARVPSQQDSEKAREAARLQMLELESYAANSGYDVVHRAGDIAMALAPNRNNFLEILNRRDWRVLVVRSRDIPMLTGLPYLEAALSAAGKRIEYMDAGIGYAENDVLDFAKQTKHLLGSLIGGVRKHDVKLGLEKLVR